MWSSTRLNFGFSQRNLASLRALCFSFAVLRVPLVRRPFVLSRSAVFFGSRQLMNASFTRSTEYAETVRKRPHPRPLSQKSVGEGSKAPSPPAPLPKKRGRGEQSAAWMACCGRQLGLILASVNAIWLRFARSVVFLRCPSRPACASAFCTFAQCGLLWLTAAYERIVHALN